MDIITSSLLTKRMKKQIAISMSMSYSNQTIKKEKYPACFACFVQKAQMVLLGAAALVLHVVGRDSH